VQQQEQFMSAGWQLETRNGTLPDFGPIWWKTEEDGARRFAFRVENSHTDAQNTLSNSALLAFADHYVGSAATTDETISLVTIQLETSFITPAFVGEIVEGQAKISGKDGKLVYLAGSACVGDRVVSRSAGIWKILSPR